MDSRTNQISSKSEDILSLKNQIAILEEKLSIKDEMAKLYKKKDEENIQKIQSLKSKLKLHKEQLKELLSKAQEDEQRMSSVNEMVQTIKSLESDKLFLKQRIKVLIAAQSSNSSQKKLTIPNLNKVCSSIDRSQTPTASLSPSSNFSNYVASLRVPSPKVGNPEKKPPAK